jgi:hypothetical protein
MGKVTGFLEINAKSPGTNRRPTAFAISANSPFR